MYACMHVMYVMYVAYRYIIEGKKQAFRNAGRSHRCFIKGSYRALYEIATKRPRGTLIRAERLFLPFDYIGQYMIVRVGEGARAYVTVSAPAKINPEFDEGPSLS